jgi:hypothetical protein
MRRSGVGGVRRGLLVAAVALAAAGAPAAAGAQAAPVLPSQDPFYSYAGPLSGIAPGTILRQRTVPLAGFVLPATATQVLYRTTNELGRPAVTVATIIRPPVALGTKLVSYQTAYDSLGPKCDPSYAFRGGDAADNSTNDLEEKLVEAYVTAGDAVVVPDYEGVHWDWTAGQESGYGTLDGIRAAESLLKLPVAGTPVAMVGYSGGSIATDYAAELAGAYAPELHIVGVAEGGVPVDFAHNLAYISGSPGWSGIMPAVLTALARAFAVNLQPYLSPLGVKLTEAAPGQCINNFFGSHPGLRYQDLLKPADQDVFAIRPLAQIVDRLIMSHTGTPRAPMLIGVGNADRTGDGVMVAGDDEALAHAYCQRGVPVQFQVYSGAPHTQGALLFEPAALTFLTARLAGIPAVNGCGSIGPGNSLAPLPIPPAPARLALRFLGTVDRRHGVAVSLHAEHGTLTDVRVTLSRGRRVLVRRRISRLDARPRHLSLRAGRQLAAGRYALSASAAGALVARRTFRIAAH